MKRKDEIFERQNDDDAMTLLRASTHCLNIERIVKYLMIFMSFSVCLAAILNRYLPQMFPNAGNIIEIQEKIATYVNMISGVVLVSGIALGFLVSRMHVEGTALQDRFEAHVFDNASNPAVLRPVSQTMTEVYAKKTRRTADDKFVNRIYATNDAINANTAQFDYINDVVHSDYKLYLYVQPFFLTIWIGFCILVMIIAVSFNDKFITTLINIMIPSLSAISIIASSWRSCKLQMRQLQNLINIIDGIQAMPETRKQQYVSDKHNMRLLADGLYEYRASAFVIPKFLIRKYGKTARMDVAHFSKRAHGETAVAEAPASTQNITVAQSKAENKAVIQPKNETKPAAQPKAENKPAAQPKTESKTVEHAKTESKTAEHAKTENKTAEHAKTESKAVVQPKADSKTAEHAKTENKATAQPKAVEATPTQKPKGANDVHKTQNKPAARKGGKR